MEQSIAGGNNLINASEVLRRVGVSPGMQVGDFGCGALGHFTLVAGQMASDEGVVYAVDILKSVLSGVAERARVRKLDNVKMVWTNLEVYGACKEIGEASLDMGFLINILFLTKEDTEVIKETMRMIKPGGKLLVIDWKREGAPFGPPMEKRVNEENIKQVAGSLGLKLTEEFEAGTYHFGLIFIK